MEGLQQQIKQTITNYPSVADTVYTACNSNNGRQYGGLSSTVIVFHCNWKQVNTTPGVLNFIELTLCLQKSKDFFRKTEEREL